jgi:hypothetical protein
MTVGLEHSGSGQSQTLAISLVDFVIDRLVDAILCLAEISTRLGKVGFDVESGTSRNFGTSAFAFSCNARTGDLSSKIPVSRRRALRMSYGS